MSGLRATSAVAAVVLAACTSEPGIITEKAPFVNEECAYGSLDSLEQSATHSAKRNGFRLTARVHDREAGAFSFLMVKPGLNVIVAGVPNSRSAYFTAIAQGNEGPPQRAMAAAVLSGLALRC